MNTMIGFIVLLVLAIVLGDPELDALRKELDERFDMEFKDGPMSEIQEKLFLQELEALDSELLEDDPQTDTYENSNFREKRCSGSDTPCYKGSKMCCRGLECTEPALYGIWYKSYFCKRPKKG
uniref:U19-hexatoxin_Hi1a_2 n=1 Tax=Hadronyche infensa TaxID=153481 RepID=A0A1D0BWC6_HADIN